MSVLRDLAVIFGCLIIFVGFLYIILTVLFPVLAILIIWLGLWSYGKEREKELRRKPRWKVVDDEDDELENDKA